MRISLAGQIIEKFSKGEEITLTSDQWGAMITGEAQNMMNAATVMLQNKETSREQRC